MDNRKEFKQRVEEYKNSVEFKKNSYARRERAKFVLIFIPIAMAVSYFSGIFFGIPAYVACTITGLIAVLLSVSFSEIKANKKFDKKSGEK